MKPFTRCAALLLCAIGLLHVLRLLSRTEVTVDGALLPMWPSALSAVIALGLAFGTWREHRAEKLTGY